jgi:hypothetical protein
MLVLTAISFSLFTYSNIRLHKARMKFILLLHSDAGLHVFHMHFWGSEYLISPYIHVLHTQCTAAVAKLLAFYSY